MKHPPRTLLLPCLFFSLTSVSCRAPEPGQARFPIQVRDKSYRETMGYMDEFGNVVIRPRFVDAGIFSEGLAAAVLESRWGYINPAGEFVIEPQYSRARPFSEGRACVTIGGHNFFIDRTGKTLFEVPPGKCPNPPCGDELAYSEGRVPVWSSSGLSYLDVDGNVVFTINDNGRIYRCHAFSEGLVAVEKDGGLGFVDRQGTIVIDFKYRKYGAIPSTQVSRFSEGVAIVDRFRGASSVIIDRSGNVVADLGNRCLCGNRTFSDGLAVCQGRSALGQPGLAGYIDKTGAYVIEPKFEHARPFSEGYAAVRLNGKWGFIDKSGKIIVEPTYDSVVSGFKNGLARCSNFDQRRVLESNYYVNAEGRVVWKLLGPRRSLNIRFPWPPYQPGGP